MTWQQQIYPLLEPRNYSEALFKKVIMRIIDSNCYEITYGFNALKY